MKMSLGVRGWGQWHYSWDSPFSLPPFSFLPLHTCHHLPSQGRGNAEKSEQADGLRDLEDKARSQWTCTCWPILSTRRQGWKGEAREGGQSPWLPEWARGAGVDMFRGVWEGHRDNCSFSEKLRLLRGKRIQHEHSTLKPLGEVLLDHSVITQAWKYPHRLSISYKRELKITLTVGKSDGLP